MSEEEKTKLEAYADGQTMRKRQSPKRKKSKTKGSVQKPQTTKKKAAQPKPAPSFRRITSLKNSTMLFSNQMLDPQTDFLAAGEREVLYGGSAGGGKSYAMLADPLTLHGTSSIFRFVTTAYNRRTKGTYI